MNINFTITKEDITSSTAICNPVEIALKRTYPEIRDILLDWQVLAFQLNGKEYKCKPLPNDLKMFLNLFYKDYEYAAEAFSSFSLEIEAEVFEVPKVSSEVLREVLEV